jgi:hypothetical protein
MREAAWVLDSVFLHGHDSRCVLNQLNVCLNVVIFGPTRVNTVTSPYFAKSSLGMKL